MTLLDLCATLAVLVVVLLAALTGWVTGDWWDARKRRRP